MVVVEEECAEEEEGGGPSLAGTVPYSLRQPGHRLRQCSLICS